MRKLLTYCIFPLLIIGLAFLLYRSISEPMKFKKELQQRQNVAVEQLKDIRTLQVTYRDTYGHYATAMDSLVDFYNNGKITIMRQIGSEDDSTAVLHTEAVKKTLRNLKGDNVKDTLFTNRPNFKVNDLRYIPFSEGDTVIMKSIVKQVSGVDVPLFEAKMPFWSLLKGMDRQQIVNLVAEREDTDRYPGLMVGSVDNANNNAGNWE